MHKISRPRRTRSASHTYCSHWHFSLLSMPPRFRTKQTAQKSTGIKAPCKCILPSEAYSNRPYSNRLRSNGLHVNGLCVNRQLHHSASCSKSLMNWLLSTYLRQQCPEILELNWPKVHLFLSFVLLKLTIVKFCSLCQDSGMLTFVLKQFVASILRCLKSTMRPSQVETSNLPVSHATSKQGSELWLWLLVHTSCIYSPFSCLWSSCGGRC